MNDPPYDPRARRDTPLALKLKERIRREGPITVSDYMRACLADPEHGYYVTRPAIGAAGDFITAPEISQIFGELIGLWSVVVWQQMGMPQRFNLVEFGAGRGTLMADALRAARVVPAFRAAADVHLIECSAMLQATQQRALAGLAPAARWHTDVATALVRNETIPERPTIILANEYLDAHPIAQWEFRQGAWYERAVDLDEQSRLVFTDLPTPDTSFHPVLGPGYVAKEGDVHERNGELSFIGSIVLDHLAPPVAALFIDYGHAQSGVGDTLQAVEKHRAVSPLYAPGESDLTAQVDFGLFKMICQGSGALAVDGPVTQAAFLGALGIMERASRLMTANPSLAHEIEVGVARLMAVPGMGDRFKAIGIRTASLPALPGFPVG